MRSLLAPRRIASRMIRYTGATLGRLMFCTLKTSQSSFWSGLGWRRPPRQLVCSASAHHPWNAARPVVGRRLHPQYWRCSSVSVPSDDRLSSWLSPLGKQAGTVATVPFRNAGPKQVAVLRPFCSAPPRAQRCCRRHPSTSRCEGEMRPRRPSPPLLPPILLRLALHRRRRRVLQLNARYEAQRRRGEPMGHV